MDQKKIGTFLKDLRKENGMTQEQLSEKLGVNSRTVSRWENANTMPDFDLMITLAKLYDVSMEELLRGERSSDNMDKQTENTLCNIAEYTGEEKERMLRNQRFFAWVGLISWVVFLGLRALGLDASGLGDAVASFAAGMACAMSILAVIYSSRQIGRIREMKLRLLHRAEDK